MINKILNSQLALNVMAFILVSHAVIVLDAFCTIDLAVSALRYLLFFYLAFLFIRKAFNKFDLLWMLFFVFLLLTTVVGHGALPNVIGPGIDVMAMIMMFQIFRKNMRGVLKAFTIALSFFIYLNLALLFIYPDGLWIDPVSGNGYFLLSGNYNGMGARFICALTTNLLLLKDGIRAKINFFCLLAASLVSVLNVHSMTSTVCILMLVTLWLMAGSKLHKKLVIAFFIFYLLIQLFVVFMLSDLSSLTALVDFIENVLHKDLTFTKRTFLWESSARLISESPLMGYGYHDKVWNDQMLGGPGAHNFIYTILLYGGYPLLIIFVSIFIVALRRCTALFDRNDMSRLLLGVGTLFFMMIFEYYIFFLIAYMLTLIYYSPALTVKQQPKNDTSALHT